MWIKITSIKLLSDQDPATNFCSFVAEAWDGKKGYSIPTKFCTMDFFWKNQLSDYRLPDGRNFLKFNLANSFLWRLVKKSDYIIFSHNRHRIGQLITLFR